jgi:hypothetical protein
VRLFANTNEVLSVHLLAVPILLCSLTAAPPGDTSNLDFSAGAIVGWDGTGFTLLTQSGAYSVSSKDPAAAGHVAFLHRAFIVPANAGIIRFKASAVRPAHCEANNRLDVVLFAAGKRALPKEVRTAAGWKQASLLPPENGETREYIWPVAAHAGQWLRVVLLDDDERPGCHVQCSGFQIQTQSEFEETEFGKDMEGLAARHKLPTVLPYGSPHFTAMSNADENFSETRLKFCETMYSLFYDHFRQKGFTLFSPASKLQVSMFDSQAGFEAYMGQKMPAEVTGLYQLRNNRFVMYDYGRNERFVSKTQEALRVGQKIHLQMDRLRYLDTVQRKARDYRTDANIATIMHEVAHQLSFNSGMLNRHGDVPLWLAEGLACYCEATANGSWQGIGEINPQRVRSLADAGRAKAPLHSLHDLIACDRWLRGSDSKSILLGYAQSWALFRFLIERQPERLRAYCALIYPQRISERRLADFQQAFGHDLAALENQYKAYVKDLIAQFEPARR